MTPEERAAGIMGDRHMYNASGGHSEHCPTCAIEYSVAKRIREATADLELQIGKLRDALENVILFIEPTVGEKCSPAHLVAYKDATDALAKSKGHSAESRTDAWGRTIDRCGQVKCEKCDTWINYDYPDGSKRTLCSECGG